MVKMLKKYERSIAILLIAFLAIPLNLFTSLATVLAEDGGDSVGENVVIHHDFESDDTHGWAPLGWGDGAKIVITDEEAAHGEQSLKFYDREGVNSSLSLNLIDKLEKGQTYDISFDVKMSEGTSTLRLASVYKYPNTSNETPWLIGNKDVGPDEWVSFELSDFEYHEETSEFIVYIETDDSGSDADFYLDNFKVIQHEDIEVPEEPFEPVEVLSFDFEADSTEGWFNLNWDGMGPAEIKTTDEAFSTGEQSLGYLNRPSDLESRLSYNLGEDLTPGEIYTISFDVKLKEGNDNFVFAAKYTSPAQSNEYPWLSGEIAVGSDDWTSYTLENFEYYHNSTELIVFLQTQSTKNDFYLDNFKVMHVGSLEEPEEEDLEEIPEDERVAIFTDFEDGTSQGWVARNDNEELTVADIGANDSSHSLLVENRQSSSDAAIIEFLDKMHPGYEYEFSLWVRLAEGEEDTQLQLSAAETVNGETSYYPPVIDQVTITADEWVYLEGVYAVPRAIEALAFYVEEPYDADSTSGVSYYIDDFRAEVFIPDYPVQTDLTPLKDIYEDMFLIGNAVEPVHFNGRTLELLRHHHNLVTAENIMKPENYYSGGEFTHSRQDRWLQNAVDNDLLIHGHVLLWHSQSEESLYRNPDGSYKTRAEALANMHEHIENVMRTADEAAGDNIISWDVVNEALAGNWSNPEDWKAQLRSTPDVGWLHSVGDDYIYEAFKHARKVADELGRHDMVLYYNDYNDHVQGKARTMYHMIKDINEQYAEDFPEDSRKLISGVGMQAHYTTTVNVANVRESIERFIDLGIEIGVTELDVGASEGTTLTDRENREQAYFYAQLFDLYREHSDHISRVTFWGLSDGNSWRSATNPLLFDRNLQAKTAYFAVADPETYLAENEDPGQVVARQGNAAFGTPVIDGEIDDIWNEAPVLPINRFQTAHNGATGEARVLWDNENIYVLVEVNDNELDKSNSQAHEQDSVEVFIDEQNTKSASYGEGHGQYRVNFDNEQSFNGVTGEGFESRTVVNGTNYLVEMKIPFTTTTLEAGEKIGFDVQINDAVNGNRNSVAIWSDVNSGMGWSDPSVFGEIMLLADVPENEVIIEEGSQVEIQPEQKVIVKSGDKEVSIKAPANLPAGTEIKVNFVDPTTIVDPKSDSGVELEIAGAIVTVELIFPEGFEDFEGEFELTLTYNTDYQWVSAFYYNEDEGVWERRTGGIIDRDKGEVRLTVSGFSTYGVFEVGAEEVIEDLEEVIQDLTNRVNELDENVAGLEELIAELRAELEGLRTSDQTLRDLIADLLARLEALEERVAELEGEDGSTGGTDGDDTGDTTPGTGDETDEEPVLVGDSEDESDDESEATTEDSNGDKLPSTATSLFNYMLIGVLVLLAGAGLALYSYKRKRA
ncbi:endo-1,4-beta-xylanase [Amphibacillus indicireducens]|uniref:Beta-xylanase n=1 Tax=Amphibacillus indicireducens TaxID=1076330 RepID=A0ABP7VC33_9BACI